MTSSSDSSFQDLASALQASTSSQAAKDWLSNLDVQLPKWNVEIPVWYTSPTAPGPSTRAQQVGMDAVLVPEPPPQPPQIQPTELPARKLPAQATLIGSVLAGANAELVESRRDIRGRASRAFTAALSIGVLGGLAIVTGAGLALGGLVAPGVVSGLGGAVSEFFANVF